jgi:transcriptional regulator with XRE-family HTH domain
MSGRSELSIRVKKLRGELSQGKFAKAIGVPQPNISAYEAGTKRPGFKPLVSLGIYALDRGLKEEAGFFFRQSGLDMDSLVELSELLSKNARDTLASGIQIANVLPHPRVPPAGKDARSSGYLQPLPAWMIPKSATTFYVRATDDFIVPFKRDDLILVDASEARQSELQGSYIVAYRPNHFSDEERAKLQAEFSGSMNAEEARRLRDRREFPFLATGVLVGRLIQSGSFGAGRAIEFRTKSGDLVLEHLRPDDHELLVAESDADRKVIEQMVRRATTSLGPDARKAKSVLQRYTDLQILGRAIGWLSSPATKQVEAKKESKK